MTSRCLLTPNSQLNDREGESLNIQMVKEGDLIIPRKTFSVHFNRNKSREGDPKITGGGFK